jgi:hypothetical protein
MKKLIVLLLTIAMVGAVSAQVTTAVSLSGSVYLWNKQSAAADKATLSPNGTLTFSAQDKDGKYGFKVKDNDLITTPAFNPDYWAVWSKVSGVKASMGSLNGGSFVQYFNNGWLGSSNPTDAMYGNGLLVETATAISGFNVGVFLPLSGATLSNTLQMTSAGFNYAVGEIATVCGQVNLDLVTNATTANVGFDYTGFPGLDAYGWFEYQQAGSKVAGGVGGQYKAKTWRAGAEFEGANNFSAWDVVANARYYVTPVLFVQVRPEYRSTNRFRVRGYVNYAFGNGFSAEAMAGYDNNPVGYTGFISYAKLGYSVSF